MDSLSTFLKDFKVHPTLSNKFWDKNNDLDPRVKIALMRIAQNFIKELKIPIEIKDIVFTGSLANFNYADASDVDLHVLVKADSINKDRELVDEFFAAKKAEWNDKHRIKIFGHEVEVYIEDEKNPHTSTGVYSLLQDKWLKVPVHTQPKFDKDDVLTKANHFKNLIGQIKKWYDAGEFEKAETAVGQVKTKLKTMRKCGLQQGGEFSTENLAFKLLRRAGILGHLKQLNAASIDKKLSI